MGGYNGFSDGLPALCEGLCGVRRWKGVPEGIGCPKLIKGGKEG